MLVNFSPPNIERKKVYNCMVYVFTCKPQVNQTRKYSFCFWLQSAVAQFGYYTHASIGSRWFEIKQMLQFVSAVVIVVITNDVIPITWIILNLNPNSFLFFLFEHSSAIENHKLSQHTLGYSNNIKIISLYQYQYFTIYNWK